MRRVHLASALAALATVFVHPQLVKAAPDDDPLEPGAAPAAPATPSAAPAAAPATAPAAPAAPAAAPAAAVPLVLDAARPVQCLTDAEGTTWRVQCNEDLKTCARAP